MEPDPHAEAAWRILRENYAGDLRFDENLRALRYVFLPDGRLIAPVMVAMLQSFDTVLFVPECAEGAVEALVTLIEIDESEHGAATDRWRIHHGEPDDVRWAELEIDSVKHDGFLVDGAALRRPNPLAESEPALCRQMNTEHPDALRRLVRRTTGIDVEQPVMVGIDAGGIDVRCRFEVRRVEVDATMTTAEDARRVLVALADQPADETRTGTPAGDRAGQEEQEHG